VPGAPPGAVPRPREADLERTAYLPVGAVPAARGGEGPAAGGDGDWDGRGTAATTVGRRPGRRRVLFAGAGIMLLAGGGVAAAVAADKRPGRPLAGAGPSPAASLPRTSPPAALSHSAAASPTPSASAASSVAVPSAPQWYVDDQGPMAIALTMDDGPDSLYTPQVLEIFRHYDIKATFNMVGSRIGSRLSLVREVSAEGHTITNHTWDHADLTHYSVGQVLDEMDRCNEALAAANQHPTIFRAPYGNWSKAIFEACAQRRLRPVGWSVDPKDWDSAHVSTQDIVNNVMRNTHAHDIILEHDGGGDDRSHTIAALRLFIPALLDRGFHFVAM
jgi:peptidoglycan/xylan/chitin deacetylase (PgdA/CDA1 family)